MSSDELMLKELELLAKEYEEEQEKFKRSESSISIYEPSSSSETEKKDGSPSHRSTSSLSDDTDLIHIPEQTADSESDLENGDVVNISKATLKDSSVTVLVRVRPPLEKEEGEGIAVDVQDSRLLKIDNKEYPFDKIYQGKNQSQIFNDIGRRIVHNAILGYNCSIFAYGQSGSGKTYTQMGSSLDGKYRGLIPRICEHLFEVATDYELEHPEHRIAIEISFLEIYSEKIFDLLLKKSSEKALKIRQHPTQGPYVEGLTKVQVGNYSDIFGYLKIGGEHRKVASTGLNDRSSRSHAIFTLHFKIMNEDEEIRTANINIVDLAGSERIEESKVEGVNKQEAIDINQSLSSLSLVVSKLAERNKNSGVFVPFRNSSLTWLLKESLGGNSKTFMIINVNPLDKFKNETISSLEYGKRAKKIVNMVHVNQKSSKQIINVLQSEIHSLKQELEMERLKNDESNEMWRQKIKELEQELEHRERLQREMKQSISALALIEEENKKLLYIKDQMTSKLETVNEELEESKVQASALEQRLKEREEKFKTLERELLKSKEVEEQMKQMQEDMKKMEEKQSSVLEKEKQLDETQKSLDFEKEVLVQERETFLKQKEEFEKKKEENEKIVNDLIKQIGSLEQQKIEMENELKLIETTIIDKNNKILELQELETSINEKKHQKMRKMSGIDNDIMDKLAELDDVEKKRTDAESALETMKVELEELKKKGEELKEIEEKIVVEKEKKNSMDKNKHSIKKELDELEKMKMEKMEELDNLKKEQIQVISETNKHKKEKNELEQRISKEKEILEKESSEINKKLKELREQQNKEHAKVISMKKEHMNLRNASLKQRSEMEDILKKLSILEDVKDGKFDIGNIKNLKEWFEGDEGKTALEAKKLDPEHIKMVKEFKNIRKELNDSLKMEFKDLIELKKWIDSEDGKLALQAKDMDIEALKATIAAAQAKAQPVIRRKPPSCPPPPANTLYRM